ncbi:alpha-amylase/4-alpha-glucanotransferase domain-containing protein [Nitrosospira sp. NpAV]|uniref:alpha-amylase/4-alpha-glucanotransferase domain-containing protein n=1 Tax=Nitrosospira sp. NpAV TaxID=58133 RepID=UPI0034D2C15C
MNEWTLPAQPANIYAGLIQQAKTAGWYERHKAFLRGGIWKNFLSRYPESNWMHKRMLGLSARLAALPEGKRDAAMKQRLYEAQANDAYWHGLFGGLYLPHLRRAVYKAIVELEAMLDACAPRPARFVEDTDLDGTEEIYLQNGLIQAVLKLDDGGAIYELDSYALRHNFGDTLQRQAEHYHHRIHRSGHGAREHNGTGIASAHDRISFKHKIETIDMEADDHARGLFVDRLNGVFVSYRHESSAVDGTCFRADVFPLHIKKSFNLTDNRLLVSYRFAGEVEGIFSTEINLAMPSCDGWGGRYIHEGQIPGGFGQLLELSTMTRLTLDDDELGGSIVLNISSPAALRAQPHYSVSQSEGGFEKIMQAVTLMLEWPLSVGELIITLEFNTKKSRPDGLPGNGRGGVKPG